MSYEDRRCDACGRFARREALRFYDHGWYCSYKCDPAPRSLAGLDEEMRAEFGFNPFRGVA